MALRRSSRLLHDDRVVGVAESCLKRCKGQFLSERASVRLKQPGDRIPSGSIVTVVGKQPRRSDSYDHAGRTNPPALGTQSLETTLHMTGNHGDLGSRDQHSNSWLEGKKRTIAGSLTCRKDDEDRGFAQQSFAHRSKPVSHSSTAADGQGVEHMRCKECSRRAIKENIFCGQRDEAATGPKGQRRSEREHIEMALVIRDQDE